MSNVGLGKICRRFVIPVPPRGYWAKKAAGRRVRQPQLPAATEPWQERISFHGHPRADVPEAPTPASHPSIGYEQDPAHHIVVAAGSELSHPIVARSARLLRRSKRNSVGMVVVPPGALRLHASRALHDRGLRLWQALLAAFEVRNYPIEARDTATVVTILGEPLELSIHETMRRDPHRITFAEQKEIDRGHAWGVPKWDEMPSGELEVAILNVTHARRRWHDGAKPIESQLNKVMMGLVRAALEVRRQRDEKERRERAFQEEQRLRVEAERRWKIEKGQRDRLNRFVTAWERADSVRTFVDRYRSAVGIAEAETELARWLEWLERRARLIDPLGRIDPSRILTLYHPTYSADRILKEGFTDPDGTSGSNSDHPPGVLLSSVQSSTGYYSTLVEVRLLERVVLPYEWPEEGSGIRTFYVPAATINEHLIRTPPVGAGATE